MKLLIIVLCLLSERFLIHSFSIYRFNWFTPYYDSVNKMFKNHPVFNNPWLALFAIVLPITMIVGLIDLIASSILYGLVGFLISLLMFFYCLGPQNVFYPLSDEPLDPAAGHSFVGDYLAQANRQLFALIFWFILAGPIAAFTYRMVSLCTAIPAVTREAQRVTEVLEWLPARMTALLYLLAGNFQRGFSIFIQRFLSCPKMNDQLLYDCGLQAVHEQDTQTPSMPGAENLVAHAVIILLVLIALFTLAAWM